MAPELKFAFRELRQGLKGFRIFLACLVLGVGAIAAVGSLTSAFQRGLQSEAVVILGGDAEIELEQRDLTEAERTWVMAQSPVSAIQEVNGMARGEETDARTLVEMKAVDEAYPLYGNVEFENTDLPLADVLKEEDGIWGVAVDPAVLSRLGMSANGKIRLGAAVFDVRGIIEKEPDRVGGGFVLAPRVLMYHEALTATNLVQVGSRVDYKYRFLKGAEFDYEAWRAEAAERFPLAPWVLRNPAEGALGTEEFIGRVSLFLTLVGLTALMVGGVGIANAIRNYLDTKIEAIAIYKCLGASGDFVFRVYVIQVALLAAFGIGLGLIVGSLAPMLIAGLVGHLLPIPPALTVYPLALLIAAVYGILVTVTFTILPLAQVQNVPPARLFRDVISRTVGKAAPAYWMVSVGAAIGIALLAIGTTPFKDFAFFFILGALVCFAVLRAEALGLVQLAKMAGRPRQPILRMALTNLYRAGNPTANVVLSMGLGLTLLVTIALIDGNLARQVAEELPDRIPSFFVIDIRKDQVDAFDQLVADIPSATEYRRIPMVQTSITKLKGETADPDAVDPDVRWILEEDRFATYSAVLPAGAKVADGEWWPENYQGGPLVSLDTDIARGLRLQVGDTITFNVLGREIEAQLGNIREQEWEEEGPNFSLVFSPGVLERAPQQHVASLRVALADEEATFTNIADAFPNVSVIWVKEALEAVSDLLEDLSLAVRATSVVTLIAGVLVLAGALASGHRRRTYDAVVMKVLGARRRDVLAVYMLEFFLLGLGTALVAAIVGGAAAYLIVTLAMEGEWYFLPGTLFGTVFIATLVTISLGLIGTWQSLREKPAHVLRNQ